MGGALGWFSRIFADFFFCSFRKFTVSQIFCP